MANLKPATRQSDREVSRRHRKRSFFSFPDYCPGEKHRPIGRLPLVSVILPVYNQAEFVAQSVESVLKQSYQNLELIIVDDGSEDNIKAELTPLLKDPRVRFFRKKNGGIASALNHGFAEAKGMFVTWTSADNIYDSEAIDWLVSFLLANPRVSLCYANVELIDENGRLFFDSDYRITDRTSGSAHCLLPLSNQALSERPDNYINACFMYRSDAAKLVGDYDSTLRGLEDYDYWLRLAVTGEVAHIDSEEALYKYRLHKESLTEDLDAEELASQTRDIFTKRRGQIRAKRQESGKVIVTCNTGESAFFNTFSNITPGQLTSLVREDGSRSPKKAQVTLSSSNETQAKVTMEVAWENTLSESEPFHSSLLASFYETDSTHIFRLNSGEHSTLLAPPLRVDPLLTLARDSSFHAISPKGRESITAGLFIPDFPGSTGWFATGRKRKEARRIRNYLATVVELVKNTPSVHWTFILSSEAQQNSLNRIRPKLQQFSNWEAIETGRTEESPSGNEIEQPEGIRSLLYIFSDLDLLVSIKSDLTDIESMLELRSEIGLGLTSGTPVYIITDGEKAQEKALTKDSLMREMYNLTLDAPAIAVDNCVDVSRIKLADGDRLFENIEALVNRGVDTRASRQWLSKNSRDGLLRKIAAFCSLDREQPE